MSTQQELPFHQQIEVKPLHQLSLVKWEYVFDRYRERWNVNMSESQNPAVTEVHVAMKTILVIEDDKSIGEFFIEAIKQETPYQALLASDGLQALDIVHSLKPDLLLLDYSLPGMNGLELYDKLQSIKDLQHIPVLLISANFPLQEVKKRKLPFLKKPVELEELLETIKTFLT